MSVKLPAASSGPIATQPRAADFVAWCLAQTGKPYVFGAHGPFSFDCSGLVIAALQAMGYASLPGDSDGLFAWCKAAGTLIPVEKAYTVRGAIVGHSGAGKNGHVFVSLGDGTTIEARGVAYGVGSWSATQGRNNTVAGLIPGLAYGVAGTAALTSTPAALASQEGPSGGLGSILDLLRAITEADTWRRIGMILGGAALVLIGAGIVKGDVFGYVPTIGGGT